MELLTPSIGLMIWSLVLPLILWLIALVDIMRNQFKGQNEKLTWVLVVIFIPLLGPILYLLTGRKNKVKLNQF